MDEMFLDVEQSGPSVAVGSVMEVAGKAPTLAQLRQFISGRLEEMPRFRQVVVPSRSRVRHAKWMDVEPDLDHHIRAVKLTAADSIDATVSQVMEIPLDRERPLWDATLVTGYSSEKWCVIVRLHHSIADGQGALILLGRLIDLSPEGGVTLADAIVAMTAPPEQEEPTETEAESGLAAVSAKLVQAVEASFETAGQFISTYPDTVRTLANMLPQRSSELTGMVSSRRTWVGGHYSLADVKRARKAFPGVTINDMVLASVAFGFTKLLEHRGDTPNGRTLRAVMPVSLRTNAESNNQVSILPAPLPLGDMDPVKRMRMIKNSTRHSKRSMLPVITDQVIKASEKVTPAPLQEFVVSRSGVASQYFSETLVTNVPGPTIPLYFMGRATVGNTPIIPIEGSMRIIVGITSYLDELNIGITGDGENASDVDVLLAGIQEGLDQLVVLAGTIEASPRE
jgi:WS/DGAT/MGAT family acyltransferase